MPELPPPLPPAERTVGQLVAETIRLYGERFWLALPLGLPLALLDQLELGRSGDGRIVLFVAFAPLLALAFACASAFAGRIRASPRTLAVATVTGTLVLLPGAFLFTWFALLLAAYLALVGLAVPVAVLERSGPGTALRRAFELARADYVHALGSLAALVIVCWVSRQVLVSLLHGQANETIRVAVFLADLVLSPVLLLGAAMLYFDQAARVGKARPKAGTPPVEPPATDSRRANRM
jgi:hypothetical protein